MEKQVLLESVIRMYGGVEPLVEELLNEIGDDPESKVTKFLQRIVDEPEEWEENRSRWNDSRKKFREYGKLKQETGLSPDEEREFDKAYDDYKRARVVEPFVANVYKKLKKGQPLNQRVRKVLEKHGNTSEQVKARKDAFAKDAFRQGQANRYGKSPRD